MHRPSRHELSALATQLRHEPAWSELVLWQELRCRKLGVSFRRQVPLAGRIADFYASSVGLIVEVDGGCHQERVSADARRDRELGQLGYRVLRLPAELVERDIGAAVARVCAALAQ